MAMNNKKTRASETRSYNFREKTKRIVDESLKEKYMNNMYKSKLDLPDAVKERFLDEGFTLSWVRYFDVIKNRIDSDRVFTKTQEHGAIFVTPSEVPEIASGSDAVDDEKYGTLITRGDLALMKTPLDEYYARRAAKEERVQQVTQGTIQTDKPSGVLVESGTTVTRGNNRFAD